ncbi:MAG: hypothetical protein QM760_14725 [Nibricoccus sp.]
MATDSVTAPSTHLILIHTPPTPAATPKAISPASPPHSTPPTPSRYPPSIRSSSETWPEPATLAVRRAGGLTALTVNLAYSGTATLNTDYTTSAATQIYFPPGIREVWISLTPIADATIEGNETITVTLSPGNNYTLGSAFPPRSLSKNPQVPPPRKPPVF